MGKIDGLAMRLGRALLQTVEGAEEAADVDCAAPTDDQSQYKGLRVGGLFIILVVSSFGIIVPLIGRRFNSALFLLRAFGAGVILATALVHILSDALGTLQSPCLGLSTEYPWAMAIATFSALLTFCAEYLISHLLRKRYGAGITSQAATYPDADVEKAADSVAVEKFAAQERLNATVTSYTLEAGVILHSIFVGIAYGVSTDLDTIVALTVALGFHQGIEGVSLACSYLDAGFSMLKYLLLASIFVLITPIGIAIGLGVGNTYHEGSKAALGTQGTLDAIAGGILIYNALVDLLIPAFFGHGGYSSNSLQRAAKPRAAWLTVAGMVMLFVGGGLQSLIGKWA